MARYEPHYVEKVTDEAAAKIRREMNLDVRGMSVRMTRAVVRDRLTELLGHVPEQITEKQRSMLSEVYKHCYPPTTKLQASALLEDCTESLNFEVIRFEGLFEVEQVVHVSRSKTPMKVDGLDYRGWIKCSGGKVYSPINLRRHRPEGDYSKTDIPDHYFEYGWLKRWDA